MNRSLLLSIKPQYARAILEGRKTIEVRRSFPLVPAGATVVLYASSPEKAVLGTVRIKRASKLKSNLVWRLHRADIAIDEADLNVYLNGADESTLLEVEAPDFWEQPVSLSILRQTLGIEPSQSFRYLRSDQVARLRLLKS